MERCWNGDMREVNLLVAVTMMIIIFIIDCQFIGKNILNLIFFVYFLMITLMK